MRHKSIGHWILRHDDDHEVQPVPRVSEEGEPANTEASRHHFHEGLQRVDNREHDSVHEGRKKEESNERKWTLGKFKMCSWWLSTEVLCTDFFLQKFLVLALRLQILFFSVSWEMSDTAGSTAFKSISLFCLTWVKNICFPFLGTESPSQSSYRLNLSGSLSAVDENVNFSEWGQMASLSPSCLNFKCSNLTQFYAVTHFLATSSQRRSSLLTTLFLCMLLSMCCVCWCHWIQSEWGVSRSHTERHSLQRHVPRLSFFRVRQAHCHEDTIDQDCQQDKGAKQSVNVKETLRIAL